MVIVKKFKKVNEDDTQSTQNVENSSSTQQNNKLIQINTQLAELLNKKVQIKNQYNNDIKNVENQILLLQKQKAELGGNVDADSVDESEVYKSFSRKLFEAVLNRTDEMFSILSLTFKEVDGLSYIPDNTRIRTYSKNIIAFLNRTDWYGKDIDKKKSFNDFVTRLLKNSQASFSNEEVKKIVDKLDEKLKENPMFNWILTEEKYDNVEK